MAMRCAQAEGRSLESLEVGEELGPQEAAFFFLHLIPLFVSGLFLS